MKLCLLACSALIAIPTASSMAHAQYADPPDDPTVVGPGPGPLHPDRTEPGYYGSEDRYAPSSVVRIPDLLTWRG